MNEELSGEELLESAEHEQLYQRLSQPAFGHSCRQVFGAALRLACVAGFGLADGVAEDHDECRPEAYHDAVAPLIREAVQGVLAGLELVATGNKRSPAVRLSVEPQEPGVIQGAQEASGGQSQAELEQIRVLRDKMLVGVMESPKRMVYHAALWVAADCYTAGAVMAGMLRRDERHTAMQKIYDNMLAVNKRWRLNLEQRNQDKETLK